MAENIGRSQRTGEATYVLSIDVDNFKAVNDRHGHAVGDRYLVEIAARLKTCVREYDTVARVGGDEFCMLVAGMPAAERIESLAERILQVVRQPFAVGEAAFTPGLSIGIAEFARHGVTRDALMLASDRALYAAKRAGRNCFRVAADDRPGEPAAPPQA
jgi:diguanylate cyclase (GGDEF)-like protein